MDNVPNPTIKPKTMDRPAKTVIKDVSIMITSEVWCNAFVKLWFHIEQSACQYFTKTVKKDNILN
jgi:hypothetical protein